MKIRAARLRDHAAIRALYRELEVPEPMPGVVEWGREIMPATVVVEEGERIAGYAVFRAQGPSGHILQVVVSPDRRRAGLGEALMREIARRLRAAGCARWHLNVKQENGAARALYEALGLEVTFAAQSLRLDATTIAALPTFRGVRVATAAETEAAALEIRFGLSIGALSRRRGVTLRADLGARAVAVARLSPASALAAPFRLRDHRAARSFFAAMQRWIDGPAVRVVVEADPRLGELLCERGATEDMRLVHMEGKLK